jgi:hypothetical protein
MFPKNRANEREVSGSAWFWWGIGFGFGDVFGLGWPGIGAHSRGSLLAGATKEPLTGGNDRGSIGVAGAVGALRETNRVSLTVLTLPVLTLPAVRRWWGLLIAQELFEARVGVVQVALQDGAAGVPVAALEDPEQFGVIVGTAV